MTLLSININKIATLRNSRGGEQPNVVGVARDLVAMGVRGITVHPRPDERHITKQDVYDLRNLMTQLKQENIPLEFNIEGYPSADFIKMLLEVSPDQCTLVPDPPEVLTSNAGWKFDQHKKFLIDVTKQLRQGGIRNSLFLEPENFDKSEAQALKEIQPDRVELYTEKYAKYFATPEQDQVTESYQKAAQICQDFGIDINAGHDLNSENLTLFLKSIPQTKEVSIGHAFICESLYLGFEKTLSLYNKAITDVQN